jgi:hypothetical protein
MSVWFWRIARLNGVATGFPGASWRATVGGAANAVLNVGIIDTGGQSKGVIAMTKLLIAVGLVYESSGRGGVYPASALL